MLHREGVAARHCSVRRGHCQIRHALAECPAENCHRQWVIECGRTDDAEDVRSPGHQHGPVVALTGGDGVDAADHLLVSELVGVDESCEQRDDQHEQNDDEHERNLPEKHGVGTAPDDCGSEYTKPAVEAARQSRHDTGGQYRSDGQPDGSRCEPAKYRQHGPVQDDRFPAAGVLQKRRIDGVQRHAVFLCESGSGGVLCREDVAVEQERQRAVEEHEQQVREQFERVQQRFPRVAEPELRAGGILDENRVAVLTERRQLGRYLLRVVDVNAPEHPERNRPVHAPCSS
jgi:hypothetical protein